MPDVTGSSGGYRRGDWWPKPALLPVIGMHFCGTHAGHWDGCLALILPLICAGRRRRVLSDGGHRHGAEPSHPAILAPDSFVPVVAASSRPATAACGLFRDGSSGGTSVGRSPDPQAPDRRNRRRRCLEAAAKGLRFVVKPVIGFVIPAAIKAPCRVSYGWRVHHRNRPSVCACSVDIPRKRTLS